MPGSLTFGALTSDRVDVGVAATFDFDPITVMGWFYATTLTNQRILWAVQGSTSGSRIMRLSGTLGEVQVQLTRATTNTNFITNTAPVALNVWTFMAFTFNSAASAGQIVNVYKGTLGATPAECTYGTATDGSGALVAFTGATTSARIGNSNAANAAWQGRIGPVAVFNAELALADVASWWAISRRLVGASTATGFWRLGNEGATTQQDYSGNANTGSTTGATQSDGPALVYPMSLDDDDEE
jgi:hypothetical protein